MSKSLVYVDQNVLGLISEGRQKLLKDSSVQFVYSNEHFSEISRSADPRPYLGALEGIDAKLLRLNLDLSWKITGEASLIDGGTPFEHFERYLESSAEVSFDENMFAVFQAWVNGGGDAQSMSMFPDNVKESLAALVEEHSLEDKFDRSKMEILRDDLRKVTTDLIERGNDIEQTRSVFGVGKGSIGGIQGKNPLLQIWKIVEPVCPGLSADQFFGFDPPDKQGYESWPTYLGVVGCCAVLDVLGFCGEKKARRIEKIRNVNSDSSHIGMGAFCGAILSADRRLIKRAAAIYEYKKISTAPLLLSEKKRG